MIDKNRRGETGNWDKKSGKGKKGAWGYEEI
jgi:hypothetical protein